MYCHKLGQYTLKKNYQNVYCPKSGQHTFYKNNNLFSQNVYCPISGQYTIDEKIF